MRGNGDTQQVTIPLSTGMNESVAERMAPTGVLRQVTNMRLRDGQLVKRGGCTQSNGSSTFVKLVGSSNTLPYPSFISRVGDVPLIANTEGTVFSYESSLDIVAAQGRMSTAKPIKERNGFSLLTSDASATTLALGESPPSSAVDSNGNVCCCVCDSGGTAYYVWIETAQGSRIYFDSDTGGTYNRSQVVATSEGFIHIVQSGTTLNARLITVGATITVGSFQAMPISLYNASSHWDSSARGSHSAYSTFRKAQFCIVMQGAVAMMRLYVLRGSTLGSTPDDSQDYNMTGNLPACSIWMDNTGATLYSWIGFYDDPASTGVLRYAVYDHAAGGNLLALTTINTVATGYGAPMFGAWRDRNDLTGPDGSAFMVIRRVDSNGQYYIYCGNADTLGTTSMTMIVPGILPLGKPDNAMRVWGLIGHGDTNQLEQRVALVEPYQATLVTGRVVVLASPSQPAMPLAISPAGSPQKLDWLTGPCHAVDDADGSTFFAFPYVLNQVEGAGGTTQVLARVSVYEYSTTLEDYGQQCTPAGLSSVVAGQPTEVFAFPQGNPVTNVYFAMSECGFVHSPTIVSITTTTATGPGAGTYEYRAVYEWVDAYGRRHRSAPSQAESITLSAGNELPNIKVSTLHMTQRSITPKLGPQIVLYRTLNGVTTFQRTQGTASAYDTNGFVTITDASADSEIDSNEFIYTDGGVLDFSLGPSCGFTAMSEDRLWCGGLWDRSIVQCSRQIIPGEPIQFADHASHQVPLGAECTGLAYQDGTVIAFTKTAIFLITGEGPNEQGIGGFPSPRIYASGIGCENPRSIVQTNAGVLFQGRKGFYIIPRGFGPATYVSGPVRHTLNSYPYCLASAHVDGGVTTDVVNDDSGQGRQSLVQWLMSTGSQTGSTAILNYDLESGQWLLDTPLSTFYCLGAWPIPIDSTKGVALAFARARQLQSTKSLEWDSSSVSEGSTLSSGYIVQTLKTAWISPFGIGGWGTIKRVLFVFERATNSASASSSLTNVTLTAQLDAQTPFTGTWAVQQGTSVGPGVEYRELVLPNGADRCTSLQVTVSDSFNASDSIGRGIRPIALVLEVFKDGDLRTTDAATERA